MLRSSEIKPLFRRFVNASMCMLLINPFFLFNFFCCGHSRFYFFSMRVTVGTRFCFYESYCGKTVSVGTLIEISHRNSHKKNSRFSMRVTQWEQGFSFYETYYGKTVSVGTLIEISHRNSHKKFCWQINFLTT